MADQDLLKAFIALTKGVQEQRDGTKITQLQKIISSLQHQNEILTQQSQIMKASYEEELKEMRLKNIKLQSENKMIKMKNSMLQNIAKEEEARSRQRFDPSQMAAFRIIQQQNQQLKALLKKYITDGPSSS